MIITSARTHDPNSSAPAGETDSRVAVALLIGLCMYFVSDGRPLMTLSPVIYLILSVAFLVIKNCLSPFRLSLSLPFVDGSVLLSLWPSRARQTRRNLRISLQPSDHSGTQAAQEPSSAPEEPPSPTVPPHGEDHPSPLSSLSDPPNVVAIHAHNSSQHSLAESSRSTIATMSRWSASAVTLVKQVLPRWPSS
ncbi:hypothetical protein B0H13DRAFT_2089691 [Mycena leptocephala]|jgi:hypothetical protein|nr:hypothetical protein B0H13DRAFT_2089691 [Mycena leptocephala]